MKKRFWKWLLRISYSKVAEASPTLPDGVPGYRSSTAICTGYSPRKRKRQDYSECEGDGHYLCAKCCHYIKN